MLRINQSVNATQAKRYYLDGLEREDYFLGSAELPGHWGGRASEQLGLAGRVTRDAFHALCDNRHPSTHDKLTLRNRANRRVGYDFNFHCPKGVSLMHSVAGDARIFSCVKEATHIAMEALEKEAATRVRKGGANYTRTTANLVWAAFPHRTSRPVAGTPDPHIHVHCYTFNATYDATESCWKAADFSEIKRHAPYFEAIFHHALEAKVRKLGYSTGENAKGRWDIKGLSADVLKKFSRRTAEIEAIARERNIVDAESKANLGARTRRSKHKVPANLRQILEEWQSRLSTDELTSIRACMDHALTQPKNATLNPHATPSRAVRIAVDRALEHCFETRAVIEERKLVTAAIRFLHGGARVGELYQELGSRDLLRRGEGPRKLIALPAVLEEEQRLVDLVRLGANRFPPLPYERSPGTTTGDALTHLLQSRHSVTVVRISADIDPQALYEGYQAACDRPVLRFAPTASSRHRDSVASDSAKPVSWLLADKAQQKSIRGTTLWVDEASLLGTKNAAALVELAEKQNARIVLAGDRKRFASGQRGNVLGLLERLTASHSQLQPRKSDDSRNIKTLIGRGDEHRAISDLKRLGRIHEVSLETAPSKIAEHFASTTRRGKSLRVVTQSKAEAHALTRPLRRALQRCGLIGKREKTFEQLRPVNGSRAEKRDANFYQRGQIVQFRQNAKGFRAGQRYTIVGKDPFGNVIARQGSLFEALPLSKPERFDVYTATSIKLARGDTLRITRSGHARSAPLFPRIAGRPARHRVEAGSVRTIKRFTKEGHIKLDSGIVLPSYFGHWDYGHVLSARDTQGRKADAVVLFTHNTLRSKDLQVAGACSRESLNIYTTDHAHVDTHLKASRSNPSAIETFAEDRELPRAMREHVSPREREH